MQSALLAAGVGIGVDVIVPAFTEFSTPAVVLQCHAIPVIVDVDSMIDSKMKRIGIMQILYETNSFNPVSGTQADFRQFGIGVGNEVIEKYGDSDGIGGFSAGIQKWDDQPKLIGLIRLRGWSSGLISAETLAWIENLLVEQLKKAGSLDGLLCSLHGAMVAEGEDDMEGLLLEKTRSIKGTNIPVVATLDLHAHMTSRMIANADILVPYHTSPHMDIHTTGIRAAVALKKLFIGSQPVCAFRKLPMFTISEAHDTFSGVPSPVYRRLEEIEKEPGVLNASILMS